MKKTLRNLSKVEKILITFLTLLLLITGYRIFQAFYRENSDITPVDGGIYTEGAVGSIETLNPLYVHQGSLTDDIVRLIFSGLTKYDPETRSIVPDLANYKVSSDGKEYTFVIKEGAKWQDGEPVTADDVLFTYNTVIKSPGFKGMVLNYNDYSGMKVSKVDERTVQFLLEKPDFFFLVKTMTGLLPEHLLSSESIEFLDSAPFNFAPIGSGRYRFVTLTRLGDQTEVSLEAFEDYHDKEPHIQNILIKAFPTFKDLSKHLGELDGVRQVPEEESEKVLGKGLVIQRYQLPQYVAAFINNEGPITKNKKVRLALQLGTDKENLAKTINQQRLIDTPLLEIDQESWVHQFSVKKANGALFEAGWKIPEPEEETTAEEAGNEGGDNNPRPADTDGAETTDETPDPTGTSEVTFINSPNEGKDWKTTQNRVTITGTVPKNTKEVIVDDYTLRKYVPGDPGWSYVASTDYDNLKRGENVYRVYAVDFNENKKEIDAITITYGSDLEFIEAEKEKREEENKEAEVLPLRTNKDGDSLMLNLITSEKPEIYSQVAEILKEQWKKIGVDVEIEVLENKAFQERLANREYDLLIFGQNLGYNLDAYPYWHSSQAKVGGYNLSQFKNFVVDSLLEKARYERDEEGRRKTLNDIQEVIAQEVPAVFLYSPTYSFAFSDKIQNASFGQLATTTDRFARVEDWYARADRRLKVNPFAFFPWLLKQF